MESRDVQINLQGSTPALEKKHFKAKLFTKKINHPLILSIIVLFSAASAAGIALFGLKAGILLIIAIVSVPVLYSVVAYPRLGIIITLIISYFLLYAEKFTYFPVGTIMDGLLVLLIFGFLLKQRRAQDWQVFKNVISIMILIWIGYNFFQIVNPIAASRLAWVYTVRTVAVVLLLYFIFLYHIRTVQFIKVIFRVWIGLSLVAALYGLGQELFGFFDFEQKWLDENPTAVSLYFIGGVWRKFSIFSDPVTFSYNMVISSILCVSLTTGPLKTRQKLVLFLIAVICIFSMLFSGTRGAYVLVPVALGMFMVLKFNKRILLFGTLGGIFMAVLVFMPTSNQYIRRFQSAFTPQYDASFNVRTTNLKKIQPYIITHPIGGGLGATGTWGQRFSPESYLANFPPDSGYVRVAVELGWVGLFIFCTLVFIVLKIGITNYYKIKDPQLKSYSLAMVLIVFALHIGNYPQEALVQYPTNVLFSLVLALTNILLTLDQRRELPKQEINEQTNTST